jgi:hypothetical protein
MKMRTHTILKLGTSSDAYRTRCGFSAVQVGDGLYEFLDGTTLSIWIEFVADWRFVFSRGKDAIHYYSADNIHTKGCTLATVAEVKDLIRGVEVGIKFCKGLDIIDTTGGLSISLDVFRKKTLVDFRKTLVEMKRELRQRLGLSIDECEAALC